MKYLFCLLITISYLSCTETVHPDLIIKGNHIYTASSDTSYVTAIAIKDGIITATGTIEDITKFAGPETEILDADQNFVMPGIIEGHGHFDNLGATIQNLNFLQDTSWNDIKAKVLAKAADSDPGQWIYGRGWHQEKWTSQPDNHVNDYPRHDAISELTPENPVILVHASGHSLFANEAAMKAAGVSKETPDPKGGHIVRDESGDAIGVMEERAMTAIREAYQEYLDKMDPEQAYQLWLEGLRLAEKECLENGITSFQDAGSKFESLERYEKLAKNGDLNVRLWVMMRHKSEEMQGKVAQYRKVNVGDHYYTCRAIKSEIDGALGSYGAWLLEPYNDKPDFYGQNTTSIEEVRKIAELAYNNEMQLCVHAIGDRANNELLDIIEDYQNKAEKNLRWRVEHAQHLNPKDIDRFGSTGAIASMQAVHCTSDAPFVVKRLGEWRARTGAYAWKSLLENGVVIVNGTDVPVEDIDPVTNFYSSVTRSRLDNGMRFFVDQKMSREQALRSMTIDAAYGAFEEDIKGSIETGKLADFTILDTNWLTCEDDDIPNTKIMYTIVGGEIKYKG